MVLFGTNGVRGKLNELTFELAFSLCSAFVYWTEEKLKRTPKIALARDMRRTGSYYTAIATAGLTHAGAEVVDLGIATSPTAEYYVHVNKLDGLVIVTASHNPPEYNALKFVDYKGLPVSPEKGCEIEKYIEKKNTDWKRVGKTITDSSASRIHAEGILRDIHIEEEYLKKQKNVLFDPGNGTSVLVVPEVMKKLNCRLISLNSHLDGTFPGRPSEPTETNLSATLAFAKTLSNNIDLGIALDGDSDRLVLIDDKGRFVSGDKVCALGAKLIMQKKKGPIVTTVATSNVLRDVAQEYGCRTIYTKVGAPYIAEAVLDNNAIFGGEEVGGLINPEFSMAKDGPYWSAKLLELFAEEKKPLAEIIDELPEYHSAKLKTFCPHQLKQIIIDNVRNELEKNSTEIIALDGIRAEISENEWVIIRASGTEEYIRVFAESPNKEKAHSLAREYLNLVEGLLSRLKGG